MNFTAARNGTLVNLKWSTTSEQNSRGFHIERMLGSGNWESIGFVDSRAPGGNSSSSLTYSSVDHNSFKGISQYRLRQIDFTGQSKLSEIRAVFGEGQKGNNITIYPNPSDGLVNVVFGTVADRDAILIDMSGRTVKQWNRITTSNIQIDNLAPGIYNLRVVNRETGEQTVDKIVINKR
jgi:hypothetical protein